MTNPKVFAHSSKSIGFEKLKDMDAFTDGLFNRIVAFQDREHVAWDTQANFADRIHDLPLHYLLFSNPDRDPATHAQTVAPFYPLASEMQRVQCLAQALSDDPLILDYPAGNGFLGSLIARLGGVRVLGHAAKGVKPNQIEPFLDPDCYRWHKGDLDALTGQIDVAYCAWMPSGRNLTTELLALRPKAIVLVYSPLMTEAGALTGTEEAFDLSATDYQRVQRWEMSVPDNLFHDIWPDLSANPELRRITDIYALPEHLDSAAQALNAEVTPPTPYDWEQELDMALTAREAKIFVREKGLLPD